MTRKKRDRNKLMESYPGAKKGNRNASIHGAEGKDGRPFWEVLWDYCCCSEAFWRRRYLERLEGTYLCDDKESMRYQNLIDQNKNVHFPTFLYLTYHCIGDYKIGAS